LRRTDGQYRWHHARAEPLRDGQQRIIQWYGVSVDVDEGKNAENELRAAQAQVARASQAATVAELSASIAHEINQPLAGIVASAQTCQTWLSGDNPNLSRARAATERIIRDGNAAADIIRRIRALFKQTAPTKTSLDINEVIDEVGALGARRTQSQGRLDRTGLGASLASCTCRPNPDSAGTDEPNSQRRGSDRGYEQRREAADRSFAVYGWIHCSRGLRLWARIDTSRESI
jgi:hypothetical protein